MAVEAIKTCFERLYEMRACVVYRNPAARVECTSGGWILRCR